MFKPSMHRAAAIAVAAGIALAPASAGLALAQDHAALPTSVQAATIDFGAKTSLTIVKSADPVQPGNSTGNADSYAPKTTLAGAEFELTKVMDIDNAAQWDAAVKTTLAQALAMPAIGEVEKGTTADGGVLNFKTSGVGLYVLKETKAPAGYAPSLPALVYLPMTNPGNTEWNGAEWNYSPTFYPKNSKITSGKTVNDSKDGGVNVGDTIEYTITTGVPAVNVAGGQALTAYYINDRYNDEELSKPEVKSIVITYTDGTSETLTADQYKVNAPEADAGTNTDTRVTIAITDKDVLGRLQADPTASVATRLDSTVLSAADGKVENDGWLSGRVGDGSGDWTPGDNPDEPGEEPNFETEEDKVVTYYGSIVINKFAKEGEETKQLAGAEFEAYRCTDKNNLTSGKLTLDGKTLFVTGTDGKVTLPGIHVSDLADDAADGTGENDKVHNICLVETKAPEGYELLAEPVYVELTWSKMVASETKTTLDAEGNVVEQLYYENVVTNPDLDKDGNDYALTADIENLKEVGSKLPSTGGMGVGLLIAGGLGIMGAGAYAARRNSKEA